MTDIFRWTCSAPPKQASFLNLKGVDSQWAIDISEGRKLPGPFPKEAYFEMNPERKTENKLELLPVKIHDHQGKVIPTEYHIVHTARQIDCIDAKALGDNLSANLGVRR